jgi:hypothetical protein
MSKTIVICGYGPGISAAVETFGRESSRSLLARNAQRLARAWPALETSGIRAAAFRTDLSKEAEVGALESVRDARPRRLIGMPRRAPAICSRPTPRQRAIFDVSDRTPHSHEIAPISSKRKTARFS